MSLALALVAVVQALVLITVWVKREQLAEIFFVPEVADVAPAGDERRTVSAEWPLVFRITAVSTTPDPKTSGYANCLALCSAEFVGSAGPEPVVLAMPAFLAREWTEYRELAEGVMIAAKVVPFDDTQPKIRRLDTADTLEIDLVADLATYYCASWQRIDGDGQRSLAALPAAGEQLASVPAPVNLEAVRQRMAGLRDEIRTKREAHGGWDAWASAARDRRLGWVAMAKEQGGTIRQAGAFCFEPKGELGYSRPASYGAESPAVQTLMQLHEQLAAVGTHLVVAPFPLREEVTYRYATEASSWPSDGVAAPRRLQIIDLLLSLGVDVVDVLPWLHELGADEIPFYDSADQHPANGAVVRVARGLADTLAGYGLPRKRSVVPRSMGDYTIPEYLELFPRGASYQALALEEPISSLPADPSVLLIGDSYLRVPGDYGFENATIHDHLCWELGYRIPYAGSPAPEVFQLLRRHRHLRESASVVVFVFSPSFFSGDSQFRGYLDRNTAYKTGSL